MGDGWLALLFVVYVACLLALSWVHRQERQAWAEERRLLVNRALARTTGEVIALDRSAQPVVVPHEPEPIPEGL